MSLTNLEAENTLRTNEHTNLNLPDTTKNDGIKSNQRIKWFAGLDSIRFVLAFIVVLSHCANPIALSLRHSNISYLRLVGFFLNVSFTGVMAVIAFFVISGFVIHYPNRNGIKSKAGFYLKRLTRVLIPLILITLLGRPFGNPEKAVVWSLYCELIYYIIYPVLVAIPASWRSKLIASFIISVVLISIVGRSELLSMLTQSNRNYNGEFWQFGVGLTWIIGLPCWLLGVNLAEKIDSENKIVSTVTIWFFRGFILFLSISSQILRFHFYISYVITLTLLAIPIMKWLETEIIYYKSHFPLSITEKWGKFSYSLYLCHPLLIAILLNRLPLTNSTYLIYLIICVGCSYLFYLIAEKPAHLLAEKINTYLKKPIHNRQNMPVN